MAALPDDILRSVLQCCDAQDLCRAGQLCQQWRGVLAEDGSLWQDQCMRRWKTWSCPFEPPCVANSTPSPHSMHGGSLCPKDQPRAAYREREMRGRLAIDLVRFWRRYPTAEHMVGRHLRRLGCEVLEDLEHVAVGLPMDQELMMRHRLASVRHTVRMNCVLQWWDALRQIGTATDDAEVLLDGAVLICQARYGAHAGVEVRASLDECTAIAQRRLAAEEAALPTRPAAGNRAATAARAGEQAPAGGNTRDSVAATAAPATAAVLRAAKVALFTDFGLCGADDDYYLPSNSYLSDVLRRRRGIPITLCTIMAVVLQRLGLRGRVKLIDAPGHFLLRVDPTEEEQAQGERPVYVDAFGQGATLSAEATAERLQLQPHGPLSALLRSTTAYGTWCRMLRNLYSIFGASRIYASPTNLLDTLRQLARLADSGVTVTCAAATAAAESNQLAMAEELVQAGIEQVNRSRSGRDGLDSLLRLRAQIMQDMDKQSQLCPPLRISRTNRVEMPPEASRLPEPVMSMPVHPVLFASESSANMKFHVGQVVFHAFGHFLGVVAARHPTCRAAHGSLNMMLVSSLRHGLEQPFYTVLVDACDRLEHTAYVPEENLRALPTLAEMQAGALGDNAATVAAGDEEGAPGEEAEMDAGERAGPAATAEAHRFPVAAPAELGMNHRQVLLQRRGLTHADIGRHFDRFEVDAYFAPTHRREPLLYFVDTA